MNGNYNYRKVLFGDMTVKEIGRNEVQKMVMLSQKVTTKYVYPDRQQDFASIRNLRMFIPLTDDIAMFTQSLMSNRILRIVSHMPIMDGIDLFANIHGLKINDDLALEQLAIDDATQQPILFDNKLQYRKYFLGDVTMDDIDARSTCKEHYIPFKYDYMFGSL